jgi:hypothetical protein
MRPWFSLMLVWCGLMLVGCQQTPQQKLVGRWYNGDMSVRFREDGRVSLFSRSGHVEGRYQFAGTNTSTVGSAAAQNLVMDVVRNGRIVRMMFDADFLGDDRLRLSDLTPKTSRMEDRGPDFTVLRRSEDAVQSSVSR